MSPQETHHVRQAAGDVLEGILRSLPVSVSEKRFQAAVRRYATELGYTVFCVYDSRRSPEGLPDIILAHRRRRLMLMAELKSEKGRLSPAQTVAIATLRAAGVSVSVWRPSMVEEIIARLREGEMPGQMVQSK